MELLSRLIKLIKRNLLLSIILIIGFLLRIISTTPGYYYPIGDELLYSQAIHMIMNRTLSFETPYFGFPPLIPWIMIPFFALFFIPLGFIKMLINHRNELYTYLPFFIIPFSILILLIKKIFHPARKRFVLFLILLVWITSIILGIAGITRFPMFQREILGKNWIDALYWGRDLTAFIGTLVILFTYKVANLYFKNKNIALLSSLFVAVNYRMVLSSHIGLPDMYNVLFLLVALYAIGKLFIKNQSFRGYLLAILSIVFFFLIKYQTHVVLPFLIAHLTVSTKTGKKSFNKFIKNFFAKKAIIAGIIGLIVIVVAHFYHFKNWGRVMEINNYEAIKYGFGRNILDLYPVSYLYYIGIGPGLSIVSILGILIGLINQRHRLSSLVLISTLPTFAFLYLYYTNGGLYTRNVISTIPIFLIFAALLINDLYKIFSKRKALSFFVIIFALFITKDNFVNSLITAKAYSSVAPRVMAQKWVDENIKEDVVFGAFLGTTWPINPKINAQNMLPYYKAFSYQEMLKEKYDYISLELSNVRDQFAWWTRQIPRIQIAFWKKPDNLLSQTFYSLAFREFIWREGQAIFISPWQAPSHNFAIVKVTRDEFKYIKFNLIKKYTNFSKNWTPLYFLPNYDNNSKNILDLTKENKIAIKSGRIIPGSARYQSDFFEVKQGYAYKVTAQIKNDNPITKDIRDGFIRLDFYENQENPDILSRPKISFVSERVYGEPAVYNVEITGIAPSNMRFATIGFQSDGMAQSTLYLNSVEIYETKIPTVDTGKHFTIKDEDLFLPNNDGVL